MLIMPKLKFFLFWCSHLHDPKHFDFNETVEAPNNCFSFKYKSSNFRCGNVSNK